MSVKHDKCFLSPALAQKLPARLKNSLLQWTANLVQGRVINRPFGLDFDDFARNAIKFPVTEIVPDRDDASSPFVARFVLATAGKLDYMACINVS
jgi:hypothetical protein